MPRKSKRDRISPKNLERTNKKRKRVGAEEESPVSKRIKLSWLRDIKAVLRSARNSKCNNDISFDNEESDINILSGIENEDSMVSLSEFIKSDKQIEKCITFEMHEPPKHLMKAEENLDPFEECTFDRLLCEASIHRQLDARSKEDNEEENSDNDKPTCERSGSRDENEMYVPASSILTPGRDQEVDRSLVDESRREQENREESVDKDAEEGDKDKPEYQRSEDRDGIEPVFGRIADATQEVHWSCLDEPSREQESRRRALDNSCEDSEDESEDNLYRLNNGLYFGSRDDNNGSINLGYVFALGQNPVGTERESSNDTYPSIDGIGSDIDQSINPQVSECIAESSFFHFENDYESCDATAVAYYDSTTGAYLDPALLNDDTTSLSSWNVVKNIITRVSNGTNPEEPRDQPLNLSHQTQDESS